MCEKCVEIDLRIAHYRKINTPALDPLTRERLVEAISKFEAEKDKLHPAQE